ncbi:MAG: hypothetical protein WDM90_25155 [Ferruginibacter sp.]
MADSTPLIQGKTHFIPLEQAIEMTTLYRAEKEKILAPAFQNKGILPICETFNREAFDYLLKEDGCVGLRFYYGMGEDLNIHIIAVGVNAANEDMLPKAGVFTDPGNQIVDDGQRCPVDCPPPSPLSE